MYSDVQYCVAMSSRSIHSSVSRAHFIPLARIAIIRVKEESQDAQHSRFIVKRRCCTARKRDLSLSDNSAEMYHRQRSTYAHVFTYAFPRKTLCKYLKTTLITRFVTRQSCRSRVATVAVTVHSKVNFNATDRWDLLNQRPSPVRPCRKCK